MPVGFFLMAAFKIETVLASHPLISLAHRCLSEVSDTTGKTRRSKFCSGVVFKNNFVYSGLITVVLANGGKASPLDHTLHFNA